LHPDEAVFTDERRCSFLTQLMLLIRKAEDKELPEGKDLTAIRFRALGPQFVCAAGKPKL